MKLFLTQELIQKHGLNAVTITFIFKGNQVDSMDLKPFAMSANDKDAKRLADLAMRCRSDGAGECSITASADGVVSTGFDTKMPSYKDMHDVMMAVFETYRTAVRQMDQFLCVEPYREAARGIAAAVAAGEIDLTMTDIRVEAIDLAETRCFADAILGAFGKGPVEPVESDTITIAGAPSFLPDALRTEIDGQIKTLFLHEICTELATVPGRIQTALDFIDGMINPIPAPSAHNGLSPKDASSVTSIGKHDAGETKESGADRPKAEPVAAATGSFGDEM